MADVFDAARRDDVAQVRKLLESSPELANARNGCGKTPLHCAAWGDSQGVAALLIAHDADVNAKDEDVFEWTPLHEAARWGFPCLAEMLLRHGADVRARDKSGRTPLYWGAWAHPGTVPGVLLQHEEAILHLAVIRGDLGAVLGGLEDEPDRIDEKDTAGMTPLHWAAVTGDAQLAELLLGRGAQLQAEDERMETPLHKARCAEVAGVLVRCGADVNAQDAVGRTPLHEAAKRRDADLSALLLLAGASSDIRNRDRRTALTIAGSTIAGRLMRLAGGQRKKGVDVHSRDGKGQTALHRAAMRGHRWVAELLLKHGADATARDVRGDTALQLAERNRHGSCVSLLQGAAAPKRAFQRGRDPSLGACKQCSSGPIEQDAAICPFCGRSAPYAPAEEAVVALLKRGYLMHAVELLTQVRKWTIARAKGYCDGLDVERETTIAAPLDDLINDLATGRDGSGYIQAIKWVRGQTSHWGLKQAKEYVDLLRSAVH